MLNAPVASVPRTASGLFDNSLKSSTPPPFNKSSAIVGFVLIT
jgi:hypothetical protein